MSNYKIYFYILLSLMILSGCKLWNKKGVSVTDASEYSYRFNKNDSIYVKSYLHQDSSLLSSDTITIINFNADSMVIEKGNKVFKFYKNYFELFEFNSKVNNLYWYRYSYSGDLIKMKYFYQNKLQYEKVNINGKVYLKNVQINMPNF